MPKDLGFLAASPLNLVAHFMTYHPEKYLRSAEAAGFKSAVIHWEAFDSDKEFNEVLLFGKHLGLKMGLAINPDTKLNHVAKFISKADFVQLMSIRPGLQGREFITSTLEKIKELRQLGRHVIIVVDGGIKIGIAKQCAKAGADILVAGSTILRSENEEQAIEALKEDIET